MRATHVVEESCEICGNGSLIEDSRACSQIPSGQFGVMYLPQSGANVSAFQSYWDVGSQRFETADVVAVVFSLLDTSRDLTYFLAPSMIFGNMVAVSRVQAVRYLGLRPALSMANGTLPQGLMDIRSSLKPLFRPMSGAPSAIGGLIVNVMVRLFGLQLPKPITVAFANHSSENNTHGGAAHECGMLQGQRLAWWQMLEAAHPAEFPEAVLTGVSEPGFVVDEAGMYMKTEVLRTDEGFLVGQQRSTFSDRGPQLVNNSGIGVGIGFILATGGRTVWHGEQCVKMQIRPEKSDSSVLGPGERVIFQKIAISRCRVQDLDR